MNIIGIDVSKNKLDCLWFRDYLNNKMKTKVLDNSPAGHQTLIQWVVKHTQQPIAQAHFVMEATGVYHEALAYALFDAGAQVSVVNPARLKSYANSLGVRSKTDKKDSVVIARYGETQSPSLWQPEATEVRELKALISRLSALEKDIQRENNRLEKAKIAKGPKDVIESIHAVLDRLEEEKRRIEKLIQDHIDNHPGLKQDRQLLESIPGVGTVISRLMLALMRSRDFHSAAQCAAYIGLNPIQHESGSSVRGRTRLSKNGSAAIRAKLYMAAVVCTQYNPDIKRQYERLLMRGKSKMAAICAAMRKLVHICFGVIKHQTPYLAQAC